MKYRNIVPWCVLSLCFVASGLLGAELKLTAPWTIDVIHEGKTVSLEVASPEIKSVQDEKYDGIVVFNPQGAPWRKGTVLRGVQAWECCVFDSYVPGTLRLSLAPKGEKPLVEGKDYQLDVRSGNIGRLEGGAIGPKTAVYASYQYVPMRIDSVICDAKGEYKIVQGQPNGATPFMPELTSDQKRLGNIYIPGRIDRLTDDLLFPISPEWTNLSFEKKSSAGTDPVAKSLLPKTWKKLVQGEKVRILAWGDSVTACGYLPDDARWQQQFVDRLRLLFPKADIELLTEAWGGRNSDTYRAQPPGSPKNYKEKVLAVKPDLIISEFVNDAGMNEAVVAQRYGEMLADFKGIGTEWVICTPHYVRPDWMNLKGQKNIDEDPRPYVRGLRQFAAANHVALADVSIFYGQLWRKGIPYLTLLTNNINHPNRYGMSLFADSLINLFQ